jgi:hypothetical protein
LTIKEHLGPRDAPVLQGQDVRNGDLDPRPALPGGPGCANEHCHLVARIEEALSLKVPCAPTQPPEGKSSKPQPDPGGKAMTGALPRGLALGSRSYPIESTISS